MGWNEGGRIEREVYWVEGCYTRVEDVMMNANEVGKCLPHPPILRTRTVNAATFTLHRQQAGRE